MVSSTLMLLDEPEQWRPAHLETAKVKLTQDVPTASLVEPKYIPQDGDEDFEDLAEVLCWPTGADGLEVAATMGDMSLEDVEPHIELARKGLEELVDPQSPCDVEDRAAAFRRVLRGASHAVDGGEEVSAQMGTAFQFTIPPLKVLAEFQSHGALVAGHGDVFDRTDPPLAVFSVVRGTGWSKIAKYEVPQALFQAVLTYNQNPYLKRYEGYVISLEDTVLHVTRARMSWAYMARLCHGKPLSEPLELCRSEAFELLECDGRRESVRLVMGLLRYLLW